MMKALLNHGSIAVVTPPMQKLCKALVDRRVLTADDVKAAYKQWRGAEPDRGDDPKAFARHLIRGGQVQEQQLRDLFVAAVPVAKPAPVEGEYDVELIPIRPVSLANLDRRDLLMLLTGAAGTLAAILAAVLLAKLLQPAS